MNYPYRLLHTTSPRSMTSALHDLWSDKSGDTEITLQLLLTLWWLLHTKESREEVSDLPRSEQCISAKFGGS